MRTAINEIGARQGVINSRRDRDETTKAHCLVFDVLQKKETRSAMYTRYVMTARGEPRVWKQIWPRLVASLANAWGDPATRLKYLPNPLTHSHQVPASSPRRFKIGAA